MSTPAERAALRILQSVPRECIRTHERRAPDVPMPGGAKSSRETARRLRQWIRQHMHHMTYREMARELGVQLYYVTNHMRYIRLEDRRKCRK